MISRTAGYALRAVLYIAQNEGEGPVRVNDMAAALDLPRNYLSKTLHLLARARVLTSTRGKLGGFELAVPSATLSLFQVVVAFDDLDTRRCLLGVRECSDRTACAAHESWKRLLTDVTDFLQNTTIEELANGLPHSA